MGSECKKIKYTRGRTRRPVIKIQKPLTPATRSNSLPATASVSSEYRQYYYNGEGEEEIQMWEFPKKSPLESLRRWVENQRFIPQDLSDEFLHLYLSGSAYVVEAAAEKLQKYFQSRQDPSFLFRNRDPLSAENQKILESLYVLPMPDTTDSGQKIILTGLLKPVTVYCQMEHLKALAMVLDLLIWEKDFGFGDFVMVLDGRNFECPQLLGNQVFNHRHIRSLILDTIPGTLRSFYFLYPPSHVANVADNRDGIWITVVKSKLEMISYLPADTLPLEYGGNLGHLEDILEQWKIHMAQCRNFFLFFEERMIKCYNRKLCYEKEVKERGKNWVQEMKLEADEWEYKTQYYEKMKNFVPLKHPAFGSQRNLCKPKPKPKKQVDDLLKKCREKAKEEEEAAKIFEPCVVRKPRKPELEPKTEKVNQCAVFFPVRELRIILSQK